MGGIQRDLDDYRVEHARAGRDHRRLTRADAGTGVFGSAFGFIVVMVFLLFAVQLLFGLYARTTITAIGSDVASDAAIAVARGADPAGYADVVRDRLGRYGEDAQVSIRLDDTDGDGVADTVAVTIDASLPTLLPSQWLPEGAGRVERTMRARIETFQEAAP